MIELQKLWAGYSNLIGYFARYSKSDSIEFRMNARYSPKSGFVEFRTHSLSLSLSLSFSLSLSPCFYLWDSNDEQVDSVVARWKLITDDE